MKKEWFIFKGTSHHGPYTLQELAELMESGELSLQSLVWKEGTEKWEAVGKIPELMNFFEKGDAPAKAAAPSKSVLPMQPILPELPEDEAPPTLPPFLSSKTQVDPVVATSLLDLDDMPPPIPLDALLSEKGERKIAEKQLPSGPQKNVRKALFAFVAVILIFLIGQFVSNEWGAKSEIKVKGVMPVYLDRLQDTANQTSPNVLVTMALSLDGKTIWVSTNKSGTIASVFHLRSLPKRVLGNQEVSLSLKGLIQDHLGKFEKMQMTEGSQFVPGEYKVHFSGRKIHWINKNIKILSSFEIFRKLNTSYNYQGDALIYAGTPREFEKKIIEYHDTVLGEKLKPYHDKLERLQTFQSLLNKAAEDYLLILEKISKGSEIKQFEENYLREVAPIIQSLVIAANDISQNKAFQEEDFRNPIAPYKEQIHLGKQIGELASDMITETKKLNKISGKDKNLLKTRFESRYRAIKLQLDINIVKVQDYIKQISN
jgi:hypothetical protein